MKTKIRFPKDDEDRVFLIVVTVVLIFILLLCAGCKSKTVYVPVESTKIEYRDKIQRDSVHLYDSIFVDRWKSNDTVFLTKEKYKYLYRDKLVRDSIFKTDSIAVPYPVVEVQEVNRLHAWQMILMYLGGVLIGYIGFRLVKFAKGL
jgi:hypothetical protein